MLITKTVLLNWFRCLFTLDIDFESQILALLDSHFWLFSKSDEKIVALFVISAILSSL